MKSIKHHNRKFSRRVRVITAGAVLLMSNLLGCAFAQSSYYGGTDSFRMGADSTSLQTGTQSTSLQTGTQSTTLQTGTQSTTVRGGTSGALIQGGVEDEAGPVNVLIVLDASRSMKEEISGQPKMACAKAVLQNAVSRIPHDINVGLRVFGQSFGNGMECASSALLVPMGVGNRASIISRVNQLVPTGMTPLTYAIRCAAEDDFAGVKGKKIMILITDGADTCGQDPCRYIAYAIPRLGIKLKVDVVGVDLKRDGNARRQLHCIAETSGGKYYDANTAAQLIDSVAASVDRAISGKVIIKPSINNAKNTETPPELMPLHAVPDQP